MDIASGRPPGAGVHRGTLHRWLSEDAAFRSAYSRWKTEMRESATARLLSLTQAAVRTLGVAIQGGDARAAFQLLKEMQILAAPVTGSHDPQECQRWVQVEQMSREATLLESENAAYNRQYSATWSDRPWALREKQVLTESPLTGEKS